MTRAFILRSQRLTLAPGRFAPESFLAQQNRLIKPTVNSYEHESPHIDC